jgi:hypothetical protein
MIRKVPERGQSLVVVLSPGELSVGALPPQRALLIGRKHLRQRHKGGTLVLHGLIAKYIETTTIK